MPLAIPPTIEPTWLTLGRRDIGIAEAPGPADNAVILGWAKALAIALGNSWLGSFYQHDSIPWCALWLAHVLVAAGLRVLPASQVLGALNWRAWGQPLTKAIYGCILVFERPGGGHVGFYLGETADGQWYFVLGGNQDNRVCVERIAASRCVARRWPAELPPYGERLVLASDSAAISQIQAAAHVPDHHTLNTIGNVVSTGLSLISGRNLLTALRSAFRRTRSALTRKRKA